MCFPSGNSHLIFFSDVLRLKIQREKYVHRLIIPSTRMADAGQYTVVAGGNTSSANLIVEGRDIRIRSAQKDIQVRPIQMNKYSFVTQRIVQGKSNNI